MSNYCACRDHGPSPRCISPNGRRKWCIHTHKVRFCFPFGLPGRSVLLLESIKCTGSLRIPKANHLHSSLPLFFFSPPSWFPLHSSKHQAAPCSSGPVSAGAYHERSDKARVQCFRTEAPLCIVTPPPPPHPSPASPPPPGNTNFKESSRGRKPRVAKFYWPALPPNRVLLHGTDNTQSSLGMLTSGIYPHPTPTSPEAARTLARADASAKDQK